MAHVDDCVLLPLPTHRDRRGALTVLDGAGAEVPFPIARAFVVHDVPLATPRGGHAHRALVQVLVCVSGALAVDLHDGRRERRVELRTPTEGLLLPPWIWSAQTALEPGTRYLVLASASHDPADYVADRSALRPDP